MKNTKKLFALMLAVLMLLSVACFASAENPAAKTFTITITDDKSGHVYEAYQIFTGDLFDGTLSNIEFGDGVDSTTDILAFSGDTYGSAAELAEALDETNVEAFLDHVSQYLATPVGTCEEGNGSYTISNLEPGYYLIKDAENTVTAGDAYTKFIAKVVKDTTAVRKTDVAVMEKKVAENEKYTQNETSENGYEFGETYNDVADYNIGDSVPFSLYSKVPDLEHYDHYTMIFHDKMDAGLTLDASTVTVRIADELLEPSEYTLDEEPTDGCTFEVQIRDLVNMGYQEGDPIRVNFDATLNSDAIVGLDGNPNEAWLEFSNNPNDQTATTTTPHDVVIVFTYQLKITKIDGEPADETHTGDTVIVDDEKHAVLKGAKFTLQNADNQYVKLDDSGMVEGWTPSEDEAAKLVSNDLGVIEVIGLDAGEYILTETTPPEGYNKLAEPIKFTITAETENGHEFAGVAANALTGLSITVGEGEYAVSTLGTINDGQVETIIENKTGATLPETGGIGTTIFYVAGGVLVLLAVVLLVTKRRVGEN